MELIPPSDEVSTPFLVAILGHLPLPLFSFSAARDREMLTTAYFMEYFCLLGLTWAKLSSSWNWALLQLICIKLINKKVSLYYANCS